MPPKVRLGRLHAGSGSPKVVLQRLRARTATFDPTPPDPPSVRLGRLRAITSAPVTALEARAGIDLTLTADTAFELNGSGSTGATTWVWTQTGGTAVTLGGSGAIRTGVTPFVQAQITLEFTLTVTGPGGTAVDKKLITVKPWQEWVKLPSGVLAPKVVFYSN